MTTLAINYRMRRATTTKTIRDLKQIQVESATEHDTILLREKSKRRSFGGS
jgi:hypothetical protein